MRKMNRPLVVLGLDVGDPESLVAWAREGHLPAIASILERGCWGTTGGPDLACEHGVWLSLVSGVSLARHGFYYFRQLVPGTYDLRPVTERDAAARPFWARFRDGRRKVAIVDVPHTAPDAEVAGLQVADWAVHNAQFPPSSHPAGLVGELERRHGASARIDEALESDAAEDARIYRRLLDRIERKGALCRDVLSRDRFDLVFLAFGETHTGTHQLWKYRPGAPGAGPEGELTHAIRDVYRAVDRELGRLIALAPEGANVCIVSSTGMEDHYPMGGLAESFCRRLGYQATPPSGANRARPIDLFRRAVPESWRVALSRSLPREARERLLSDRFRAGTDWPATTAFAIPSAYTGFVRVNLRGREPAGAVEPGAAYDALLDRLEADVAAVADPRTGRPAVRRIVRIGEAFGCGAPDVLPDLFVEWEAAPYFVERATHPKGELTQTRPEFYRGSDHSARGFCAFAGPDVARRGDLGEVSLLDLAPTFLALLGEPPADEMAGRPFLGTEC